MKDFWCSNVVYNEQNMGYKSLEDHIYTVEKLEIERLDMPKHNTQGCDCQNS